jgi:flagellar export protein FliJ
VKRYRFRLEAVLRVRRIEEERELAAFAAARRAAAAAERAARDCLHRYQSLPAPGAQMVAPDFIGARGRLALAADTLSNANAAHAGAVRHVESQREQWTVAAQRVSSLERLDLRKREEYEIDVRRDEDKTVDDLVTGRFGRRR